MTIGVKHQWQTEGKPQRREQREKREVNRGSRLFAYSVTDASSFIQMEVNQHTGGGSALNTIWQSPQQD